MLSWATIESRGTVLAGVRHEQHRPPGRRSAGEQLRDLEHRHGARAVVVGAVVYRVGAGATVRPRQAVAQHRDARRLVRRRNANGVLHPLTAHHHVVREHRIMVERPGGEADVVVVGTDGDVLGAERRIGAGQDADHVARGIGRRRVDEPQRPGHGATRRAHLEASQRRDAEQARRGGRRHEQRHGRHAAHVVGDRADIRRPEAPHRCGWNDVQHHRGDPGGVPIAGERSQREEAPVAPAAPAGRHGEHDELAGGRGRVDERSTELPTVHGAHAVERRGRSAPGKRAPRAAGREGKHVGAQLQRGAIDREGSRAIDARNDHRHRLEVCSVVTTGTQAHALHLPGDVVRHLHVAQCPRLAPQHGVVGDDVEPGHEIRRCDGALGRHGGMAAGQLTHSGRGDGAGRDATADQDEREQKAKT